jgi:oligogalacturonide lyase
VLDLKTNEAKSVVEGRVRLIDAGRRNERVYYTGEGSLFWTDNDSGETRRIAALPPRGSVATINADETLLAGTCIEGPGQVTAATEPSRTIRSISRGTKAR